MGIQKEIKQADYQPSNGSLFTYLPGTVKENSEKKFFQLVNDVESRQMAAEILFGPRPKAEGRNDSRLPFACLRQSFINVNNLFLTVFHNVTGE